MNVRTNSNAGDFIPYRRPWWKKPLLWSLVSVLLIMAGSLRLGKLNYDGYCFQQNRYMTDEERIQRTVEAIVSSYPRLTYAYDILPKAGYEVVTDKSRCCLQGDASRYDGSVGGVAFDPNKLIPYRGIEDFFAVNRDCCSAARYGLYGELGATDFWSKIGGFSAGFASVKYRVRYRDMTGKVQEKYSAFSANFTNCGKSVNTLTD